MEEFLVERSNFALVSVHRTDSLLVQSLQILDTLIALDDEFVSAPRFLDLANLLASTYPVVQFWRVFDNHRAIVNVCRLLVRRLADY